MYPTGQIFRCVNADQFQYFAFCDDFGPMNLSSIGSFVDALNAELETYPDNDIVLCSEPGQRALTNSVFLLGAFLLIQRRKSTREVAAKFNCVDPSLLTPYRDATHFPADFSLHLEDCWGGMERAMQAGWMAAPQPEDPRTYGRISLDEYNHYDDPRNGDLHEVIPGKFVAFKGPKNLGGAEYRDERNGHRNFSPAYYADIFAVLGVIAVVRLNEPEYDAREFSRRGIRVYELEFEDCTAPPDDVARAFLRASDDVHANGGLLAVHCRAGLGRTGTLIALYMMRSCGFTAREAMGWLRIMRPGSVIGEQQQYLCRVEHGAAMRTKLRRQPYSSPNISSLVQLPRLSSAAARSGTATPSSAATHAAAPPNRDNRDRSASLRVSSCGSAARAQNARTGAPLSPIPALASSAATAASSLPQRLARAGRGDARDGSKRGGGGSTAASPWATELAAQVALGMEGRSAARLRRSSAAAALTRTASHL